MTKTIFCFFLITCALLSQGQLYAQRRSMVKEWDKSFGGSNTDEAHCIIQTNDGGFVVAGRGQSTDGNITDNATNKNNWIVRTDAAGNILWKKSYGNVGGGVYSIIQTTDGGFAAAGMARAVAGNPLDIGDFWILKTDANGNIQWEKTYGGSNQDNAYSIIQTCLYVYTHQF